MQFLGQDGASHYQELNFYSEEERKLHVHHEKETGSGFQTWKVIDSASAHDHEAQHAEQEDNFESLMKV